MAHTIPAASTVPSGGLGLGELSEKELFELGQYEKIIQLRDVIISRKHPTTAHQHSSNASPDSKPAGQNVLGAKAQSMIHEKHGSAPAVPSQPPVAAETELKSSRAEIKSDQRVKDELQAQRERLERALKDEVEQLRADRAAISEPSAEIDSSDVLAKALALVEAATASAVDDENLNANAESIGDSFDESTFYSSRHDTPESHLVSRIRTASPYVQAPSAHPRDEANTQRMNSQQQQQRRQQPLPGPVQPAPAIEKSTSLTSNANLTLHKDVLANNVHPQLEGSSQRSGNQQLTQSGLAVVPAQDPKAAQLAPMTERSNHSVTNASSTSQMSIVPGLNNYVQATGSTQVLASRPAALRQDGSRNFQIATGGNRQALRDCGLETPPSPLVRNHNTLQPVAPQPTNPTIISALAAASSATHGNAHASGHHSAMATPAQVHALRTEQYDATSPDSSSQGGGRRQAKGIGKRWEKQEERKEEKKKRKKKRKADAQGGVSSESIPAIKQEARSPSPLNAPSFIRPSKRARHVQEQSAVHEYAPSHDTTRAPDVGVEYVSRSVGDNTMPTANGEPQYSNSRYYDEQVLLAREGSRHHQGHALDHPTHYLARTAPAPQPVPQVVLADSHSIHSRPYRDYQDGLRMSAHADGETFMPPPPPPARILVDAYGREYYEPSHHIPSRLSVTSSSRHGEHEILYERVPSQAVSRHPMPGPYDDGGLVYSAPTQAYAWPRRVVTQPGYINHDYRDVRQREFSSRPLPAQGDFVQVMTPNERRFGEDGYSMRPASARPVDGARYPMPPDYGRVHSVQPEVPVATEYVANIQPDNRRDTVQPYSRGYHPPAPVPDPAIQRPYSVRPPDPSPSGRVRGADDVAFIERPSVAPQDMVYANSVRREYYR
ncbi:hypothetical protein E4U56_006951 [Claviceps arundinis]|uniref:Uncharacterized protein n=1 Tax=Claviceps arundinis TaxID=1623583 RepID=A0A9P7SRM8_9HYPO|nr:hypothetical protein E4U56_006951 [Claviceps arundinis]